HNASRQGHMLGRRGDVPDLLAGTDVFALATRGEALGTSVIEAGSVGLPVGGTNVGGVPQTMEVGVTGILDALDDIPDVSVALDTLIRDPDLRTRMGQAGRERYQRIGAFSHESLAVTTETLYHRWINEVRS